MRIGRWIVTPLGIVLLFATLLAACSSDDGGESVDAGGGAAPAASSDDPADEGAGAVLKQTFDMGVEVTSPVFSRIRRIPKTYVCQGGAPKPGQSFEQNAGSKYSDRKNISPPLEWTGIPAGTQSIAMLMDSDQIPGDRWLHWLIWNLPPDTAGLPERVATTTDLAALGPETRQGINDNKLIGYSGPCPVPTTVQYSQTKVKIVFEYVFNVYALDTILDLPGGATKNEFLQAIDGHILSGGVIKGEFVGSKQMN